ncbi:MAG: sulfatase-like hydrolase/transferase [Bacteroidota bacterium]
MIKNLSSLLRYFLFWYVIFVLARVVFIILNWSQASAIDASDLWISFYHGLLLDISMTCYVTVLPVLLWFAGHYTKQKKLLNKILKTYNILLLSVVVFVTLADGELYQHWGQKLNGYASSFARFPKEMLVFSSGGSMLKFVLIILGFSASAYFMYSRGMKGLNELNDDVKKWQPPVYTMLLLALLFLGIRGGVGKAAINQSSAFYSSNIFLNHVAINTTWNLLASFVESSEDTKHNPYLFLDNSEAQAIADVWFTQPTLSEKLFNQSTPNIVLVVLEGWTADVIAPLGGEQDVTPNLNALCKEGLLFDQFYANGNRTDKGLAAIISSQPSLARSSIINNIQKFTSLPSIPSALKQLGYGSSFYYGGASEFANMKGYWLSAGYEEIVDLNNFPLNKQQAEWGVHDDVLWEKVLDGIGKNKAPFFTTVLTLSSHEPFNVPHHNPIFAGDDDPNLYRNSVNFADKALGDFFVKAKQQAWYNNTVFIILSDHGHQWPKNRLAYDPQRFRIPFLIAGGALMKEYKGTVNHTVAGQVDIAATLLHQLHLPAKGFNWSRNFLDSAYQPFATFVYNDGIGIIKPQGSLVFDQESKQRIVSSGDSSQFRQMEKQARVYEQLYYEEYIKR